MSKFSKYLSRVITLSNSFTNANKDAFEEMFKSFDALEEELKKSKSRASRAWDKSQKDKTTVTHLMSINEDDTESPTHLPQEDKVKQLSNGDSTSSEGHNGRRSKKRSKHEVEGMESPEQEKRQKRNASVKAQSIISKQVEGTLKALDNSVIFVTPKHRVNLNLNEKLRRDKSPERGRRRRGKEDDKENAEPLPVVKVKQEKISIPPEPEPKSESKPEPMEVLSVDAIKQVVKQEASKDDVAMPPPAAPGPKSRRGVQKEKSEESTDDETPGASRRGRRTRKQTDTLPAAQTVRPSRAERASARVTKQTDGQTEEPTTTTPPPPPPPADTRPKRTRAKKVTETNSDAEKETQMPVENGTASPAEKPRPKRTRRAAKVAEKEAEKVPEPTQTVSEPTQTVSEPNQSVTKPEFMSPKEERISSPVQQPIKQKQTNTEKTKLQETKQNSRDKETNETPIENGIKNLNNNYHSTDVEKILTKNSKNANKNYEHCEIIENKKVLEKQSKINDKIKMKNEVKHVDAQNKINSNLQEMKEMNSNLKEMNSNLRETVVIDETDNIQLDKAKVSGEMDTSVVVSKDLDRTMVLPNGVYNHAPITPVPVRAMNATVVLEHCRETMVLEEPRRALMDATVVLDKDAKAVNLTDDNSLLTDDSDTVETETPQKKPPVVQPLSAVKEKVQQFEEMASRQTRTKTRAMAKKEEIQDEQTPPDKVSKVILTNETLDKMNSMIFNGKPLLGQAGKGCGRRVESATKPRAHTPVNQPSLVSSSASKLSGINKAREADELRREREDARKKKEALLEAKREAQRKKREEKMAAAAAAREAAERERRAAMEAAVRERMEKQAHADQGKLERLKEVEKKKLETARKVAETEERRRAEEQARQQRLEEELRRADAARKKQLEEAEASRKEAAIMQKEIERRQKELMEKRKMKQRMEGDKTPLKTGSPRVMDPVHMEDGFQYLNSDSEDEEAPAPPVPDWCASKTRRVQLCVQELMRVALVDVLYSVRAQTPDLSDIFPNIERARLKRTSSAVWRVSPARAALSPLAE